jgi:hypothetical protein
VIRNATETICALENKDLPTYAIERNIPNAGRMSDQDFRAISRKSCEVIDAMNGRGRFGRA